jgi:hypothetical protein
MRSPITRFAMFTLLWLPLTFLVWYFSSPGHAELVGQILQWLVNASFPVKVPMVRKEGVLEFLLSVPASLSRRGGDGSVMATITLDILIYSCGIPLFFALMLATPRVLGRWRSLLVGLGWLLVYEVVALFVSTCYNTLNMLHMIGADTGWLFGLPWSPQLNLLAQTTFALVLPSALAVFLWASLSGDFLRTLGWLGPEGLGAATRSRTQ